MSESLNSEKQFNLPASVLLPSKEHKDHAAFKSEALYLLKKLSHSNIRFSDTSIKRWNELYEFATIEKTPSEILENPLYERALSNSAYQLSTYRNINNSKIQDALLNKLVGLKNLKAAGSKVEERELNICAGLVNITLMKYIEASSIAFAKQFYKIDSEIVDAEIRIKTEKILFEKQFLYNSQSSFRNFLTNTYNNACIDITRNQKRMPIERSNFDRDNGENNYNPVDNYASDLLQSDKIFDLKSGKAGRLLKSYINELPQEQQDILHNRLYNKKSFKEISEETGVNVNTLLGRMHYAILALRKAIPKELFNIDENGILELNSELLGSDNRYDGSNKRPKKKKKSTELTSDIKDNTSLDKLQPTSSPIILKKEHPLNQGNFTKNGLLNREQEQIKKIKQMEPNTKNINQEANKMETNTKTATENKGFEDSFGFKLWTQRIKRNMSEQDLANNINQEISGLQNITPTKIHRWESNQELPNDTIFKVLTKVLIQDNESIKDKEAAIENLKTAFYLSGIKGMNNLNNNKFGDALFELRQSRGFTEDTLAKAIALEVDLLDIKEKPEDIGNIMMIKITAGVYTPSRGLLEVVLNVMDSKIPLVDDRKNITDLYEEQITEARKPKGIANATNQITLPTEPMQPKEFIAATVGNNPDGIVVDNVFVLTPENATLMVKLMGQDLMGHFTNKNGKKIVLNEIERGTIGGEDLADLLQDTNKMDLETYSRRLNSFEQFLRENGKSDTAIEKFKKSYADLDRYKEMAGVLLNGRSEANQAAKPVETPAHHDDSKTKNESKKAHTPLDEEDRKLLSDFYSLFKDEKGELPSQSYMSKTSGLNPFYISYLFGENPSKSHMREKTLNNVIDGLSKTLVALNKNENIELLKEALTKYNDKQAVKATTVNVPASLKEATAPAEGETPVTSFVLKNVDFTSQLESQKNKVANYFIEPGKNRVFWSHVVEKTGIHQTEFSSLFGTNKNIRALKEDTLTSKGEKLANYLKDHLKKDEATVASFLKDFKEMNDLAKSFKHPESIDKKKTTISEAVAEMKALDATRLSILNYFKEEKRSDNRHDSITAISKNSGVEYYGLRSILQIGEKPVVMHQATFESRKKQLHDCLLTAGATKETLDRFNIEFNNLNLKLQLAAASIKGNKNPDGITIKRGPYKQAALSLWNPERDLADPNKKNMYKLWIQDNIMETEYTQDGLAKKLGIQVSALKDIRNGFAVTVAEDAALYDAFKVKALNNAPDIIRKYRNDYRMPNFKLASISGLSQGRIRDIISLETPIYEHEATAIAEALNITGKYLERLKGFSDKSLSNFIGNKAGAGASIT